ncbi:NAD(P)/FAD-dependent oxidoreductase [Sulfurimonas sp. SAG-AH-194-L11]|nr:NAD(P)/FAD-dependent oxidoreductase [Sulfurimonas sp. SAG-AH-194-L11]MDF1877614.1 NAD(P)/FAD-dependent oxidoreductase [Sulfurimonas sp. SAG-AH-194-L11]
MQTNQYDLIIIGGGPAGTPVAMEYAKLNPEKKIALLDALGELGGECLFDGCIPSKIMQVSAKSIDNIARLEEFGIELEDKHYKLAWEKIVQRKEFILSKRSNTAKDVLATLTNVQLIKARARFLNEKSIEITKEDDTTEILVFDKCVIGVGSKAHKIHFEGNANDKILDNETFFDRMEFPKSLSIIGSGAIAVEFAQILATLGCKINLFSRSNTILKNIDAEASALILKTLQENKNINVILNAHIKKVMFENEFTIHYFKDGITQEISSQKVLSATGRVANIEHLALDKADVEVEKSAIVTDKHLQTSNKSIYANGDVVARFPKFAHTAQYGAHTIAQNLFLEHNLLSIDFDKNSWVLFSEPNVAMVGISEKEARKRGLEILVDKYEFAIDAKAQIEAHDSGFVKYVVDKDSKVILGITIVAYEANSIAGEAALIVANRLTLSNLISTIHPHPTLSESFSVLAKMMMGKIMQEKLKNPLVKTLLEIERFL